MTIRYHKKSVAFGDYIKNLRIKRDISLRWLAKSCGVSHNYIWLLERGCFVTIPEKRKAALAEALQISIKDMPQQQTNDK